MGIGIDYVWIEVYVQNCGDVCFFVCFVVFLFVIVILWWGFVDFGGIFVDCGVQIGCVGVDVVLQYCYVYKS